MKTKYQLIVLNIFISITSIYFTYIVYYEYKQSQQIKIEKYIQKTISQNERAIQNTLLKIKNEIEQDKELFKQIHSKYTKLLRKDPTLDIFDMKEEILSSYNLQDKNIELFLLNSEYTITDSTYKPDIGFRLADVTDARIELDKSQDGGIYQSPSISIDIINSEIKSYSYSKINDKLYFEMGFINKKIKNILKTTMHKIQLLTNEQSKLYRIEQKTDGTEYYDDILDKDIDKTKEEYLNAKKKFRKDRTTDDLIILSNRRGENLKKYLDNSLIVYIPLIKKQNDYLKIMGDFVLELYINREYEHKLNQKVETYFLIFLIFHIFFLGIIFYFTIKYHASQKGLYQKLQENKLLLQENKDFISGMAKQVETPLSVIINNYDFIKNKIDTNLHKYDEQISSSINMLEKSYSDLNYIVNNDKFQYKPSNIDFSHFLHQRVEFFDIVAKSQQKSITTDIAKEVFVFINQTEIERLIDNNISNAIKYSDLNSQISITLKKDNNKLILSFYSQSSEIQNKEKIFQTNFQETTKSTKSLGLGLSMVKSICDKYNINYHVTYENGYNIFNYNLTQIEA